MEELRIDISIYDLEWRDMDELEEQELPSDRGVFVIDMMPSTGSLDND